MKKIINILQLYPADMNIYGDEGNVLVIKKRLKWYGYEPNVIRYNVGDKLPQNIDIVIGGGGQDSGQDKIHSDLLKIGGRLQTLADNGVPMLMVCGLYQLFGHYFKTLDGKKLTGIGLLDIKTIGGRERMIGNITTNSQDFGKLIGYENHSGETRLGRKAKPLGKVILGAGNNLADGYEGARYKNVVGTYMHGSILPKNPRLADFLIATAVYKKFGEKLDKKFDDSIIELARKSAEHRPR